MLRAGIKRLSALVFAVLTLSLTLSAAEITEKPGKEFFVYGDKQSNEKIAEILEETADSLDNYCYNNGIIYLAINEKNTKQIRLYENSTAFSESVGELTSLSDDKIAALAPEIAGEGFHTETVAQIHPYSVYNRDLKKGIYPFILYRVGRKYRLRRKGFFHPFFRRGRCEEDRKKALRLYFYGTHRSFCTVRRIYSLYAHTGYKG